MPDLYCLTYSHFGFPIRYAELGVFSVISAGILTLFYSSLIALAKVFLDPLDNEDFADGCVQMDLSVLIREFNGASRRWMAVGQKIPN